jgi:cullin 1
MERLMIGKLKLRCGAQFTSKMEGMLNDLSIGTDTSRSFENYVRTSGEAKTGLGKMEFSVQVLTTGNWPTYKVMDLNLPPVMQRGINTFQQFYNMESKVRIRG